MTKNTKHAPLLKRRERKRQETRQRIYRAAMELFAERGFLNTTVENITEAADVGKGTFFNYFPSKEHVFSVLFEIQLSKVSQAFSAAEGGRLPIREVLHQFVYRIVEEPARGAPLARGLLSALFASEAVQKMFLEMLNRGRKGLAEILARGQERGEVRRDVKADEIARIFQQATVGTVTLWSLGVSSNLKKSLDGMFELFWSGISTHS